MPDLPVKDHSSTNKAPLGFRLDGLYSMAGSGIARGANTPSKVETVPPTVKLRLRAGKCLHYGPGSSLTDQTMKVEQTD